jgi:hypothetical protein
MDKLLGLLISVALVGGVYLWLDPSSYWEKASFPFIAAFLVLGIARGIVNLLED